MNWDFMVSKIRNKLGLPTIFKGAAPAAKNQKEDAIQPASLEFLQRDDSSLYIDALKRGLLGGDAMDTWAGTPDHWNDDQVNSEQGEEAATPLHPSKQEREKTTGGAQHLAHDRQLVELDWHLTAPMMVGWKRLTQWEKSIYHCLDAEVPGDFVDAGVWQRGTLILAAAILHEQRIHNRKVWGLDSFRELPVPDPEDDSDHADIVDLSTHAALALSEAEVRKHFHRWGVSDQQVNLIQGDFKSALPKTKVGPIALLRLDGHDCNGTIQALEALETHVSANGLVIIDDFHASSPCAQAVRDYRAQNNIDYPLQETDGTAVYWTKSHQPITEMALQRRHLREDLYGKSAEWQAHLRHIKSQATRIAQAQTAGIKRFDWINRAMEARGFKDYLEIGVRNPADCFNRICAENKTSVDPGFEFAENPVDFPMTSDDFFEALEAGNLADLEPDKKWDLIFIDGLHQARQVDLDIQNARRHIASNGMIVLHDCLPPNEHYAHDRLEEAITIENSGSWNGSTWRAFYKHWLESKHFVYAIDADWGLGIIDFNAPRVRPAPDISDWGLDSLHTYKAHLARHGAILTSEEALKCLRQTARQDRK